MKVKVDEWGYYSRGGIIVFDTDTLEHVEIVTWDDEDPRNDNPSALSLYPVANAEQKKMFYRKINRLFEGDLVLIKSGRKFFGEQKTIASLYTYRVKGTYGHGDCEYAVFTDGTKVAKHHCQLV